MIPGKVYVHKEAPGVIVLAVCRVDEAWCNYLVLCTNDNDPYQNRTVDMEDSFVRGHYREWPL